MKQRLLLISALVLIIPVLAACSQGSDEWNGHDIDGIMPDLAYTLTREDGQTVDAGTYAGQIRLLFFGFTHCPDICPVTLARLQAAVQTLPPAQREHIQILFVSVDPQRDTPERLREYTGRYGKRIVGLTGSQEQLRALTKRFRVTYGYGETDDNGYYPVAHSSGVFVFGPEGNARLLLNQSISPQDIAADLKRLAATAPG